MRPRDESTSSNSSNTLKTRKLFGGACGFGDLFLDILLVVRESRL